MTHESKGSHGPVCGTCGGARWVGAPELMTDEAPTPVMKPCPDCAAAPLFTCSVCGKNDWYQCRPHFTARIRELEDALRPFAEIGTRPDRTFDYYTPAARFFPEIPHAQVAAARKAMGWDQ